MKLRDFEDETTEFICANCGKTFFSNSGQPKYHCSKACKQQAHRRKMSKKIK